MISADSLQDLRFNFQNTDFSFEYLKKSKRLTFDIRRLVVSHDDAEDATQGPDRGPVPTEPDFM